MRRRGRGARVGNERRRKSTNPIACAATVGDAVPNWTPSDEYAVVNQCAAPAARSPHHPRCLRRRLMTRVKGNRRGRGSARVRPRGNERRRKSRSARVRPRGNETRRGTTERTRSARRGAGTRRGGGPRSRWRKMSSAHAPVQAANADAQRLTDIEGTTYVALIPVPGSLTADYRARRRSGQGQIARA